MTDQTDHKRLAADQLRYYIQSEIAGNGYVNIFDLEEAIDHVTEHVMALVDARIDERLRALLAEREKN